MNDPLASILIGQPDDDARTPQLRSGVVTQVSPLLVRVGSATTAQPCAALSSYGPTVGDAVQVLVLEGDRLVLGKVAGPRIQAGSSVVTTNAGGGASITFPVAFSAAPASVVAMNGDSGIGRLIVGLSALPVASGFSVDVAWHDGTSYASGLVRIDWIAVGS